MALSQFSPTEPLSQPSSSSDLSDSNIYEDLLSNSMCSQTNNTKMKNHSNTTIVYAPETNQIEKQGRGIRTTGIEKKSIINGTTNKKYKPNYNKNKTNLYKYEENNLYDDGDDDDDDDTNEEDIAKMLAQHPCTPRPSTLPFDTPLKQTQDAKKKRTRKKNMGKVSKNKSFSRNTLKPITTPRPESVGADSTDTEEDDEEEDNSAHRMPDEDDISAIDYYHLRRKQKWRETQKGGYHAYTTGDNEHNEEEDDDHESENKQSKPHENNTMHSKHKKRRRAVRGAEYFPAEELDGRYEFVRYLGHGAYGYVAEGRHTTTGKKVAIKKILRIFHNRIDAKRLLRELKILRVLRGLDSIVQLIDILPPRDFEHFDQIILVFEFIDTDLSKLIQSDQYFTKLHVQYMLYQVLLGIKFMHSLNIFHRDLKPANILVNEDVSLKICDFGLARCTYNNHQFERNQKLSNNTKKSIVNNNVNTVKMYPKHRKNIVRKRLTQHVVTRWYRAPEVILLQQKREYLGAVDMWSVGCIFGELLQMLRENLKHYQHRKPIFPGQSSIPLSPPSDPFPSMDQLTVIFGIIGTPTPEEIMNIDNERAARFLLQIPKCLPSPLKNMYPGADEQALSLLRGLLQFDVEKRITVDEALSHPFIQHVRDEQNEKKFDKMMENIKNTNALNFEFEDIKMKMDTYRSLIIEEVLRYNPHLLQHNKSSSSSLFDFV